MTTVVYVHGSGVRHERAAANLQELRESLGHGESASWRVRAFFWSGARPPAPVTGATRQLRGQTERDEQAALWSALILDPLFELRQRVTDNALTSPVDVPFSLALIRAVGASDQSLFGGELRVLFERAVDRILSDPELDSVPLAQSDLRPLVPELARAIAATVAAVAAEEGDAAAYADHDRLELLASRVVEALGGGVRGPWRSGAARLAVRLGLGQALDKVRNLAAEHAETAVGDILHYQARGVETRVRLAAALAESDDDHVVVAHSLGSVIAFETLLLNPGLRVRGLVTFGSPIARMYELDSLGTLRLDAPLPDGFPAWTNLVDKRDWLAYGCQHLWPQRVRDVEVDSGLPYPLSHSAYLNAPALISAVAQW